MVSPINLIRIGTSASILIRKKILFLHTDSQEEEELEIINENWKDWICNKNHCAIFWPPTPSESCLSCVSWLPTYVACISWLTTCPFALFLFLFSVNFATHILRFTFSSKFTCTYSDLFWHGCFWLGLWQLVQFSQTQHSHSQPHPKHHLKLKLCWSIRNHIL